MLFFCVCIPISVLYNLPSPWIVFVFTFFTVVQKCYWKIVSDFISLKESLFYLHLKDLFAGYVIFGWQFSFLTIKMSLHDLTCIISENMFLLLNLCTYFWLCWVSVAVHRPSLVAVSRDYSSLWCLGFFLQWLLLLQSTDSRVWASIITAYRLSSCCIKALEHAL